MLMLDTNTWYTWGLLYSQILLGVQVYIIENAIIATNPAQLLIKNSNMEL